MVLQHYTPQKTKKNLKNRNKIEKNRRRTAKILNDFILTKFAGEERISY
ncbi:hypothetical protein L289_2305 [Acinetobacter gerneri DSM 14967 = CIP 107464 = MTCC 9824]|nr:hypothetical protein L289_2305 [Acinetobacter gerneri DSM 14967 = CIP 107464 = MTCC 9824]